MRLAKLNMLTALQLEPHPSLGHGMPCIVRDMPRRRVSHVSPAPSFLASQAFFIASIFLLIPLHS